MSGKLNLLLKSTEILLMLEVINMKLSVLVPIYNVAKYLNQCLDSLHAQTMDDMEILCLNDGSTDESQDIIEEYLKLDNRFKLISKPNTGYGNTMNVGLDNAKGQYIAIVESDDFIAPKMMEDMVNMIESSKTDLVKGAFLLYTEFSKNSEKANFIYNYPYERILNPMDYAQIFLEMQSIWSAIYSAEFIRKYDIRFNETPGASFQDVSFAFKVYANAKKIMLTNHAYYFYRTSNPNSSVKMVSKLDKLCTEINCIEKYIEERMDVRSLEPIASRLFFRILLENYYDSAPSYQYAFLQEITNRLRINDNRGDFDASIWDDEAVAIAHEILKDKDAFYKKTGKKIFDIRLWQGTMNASVYKDAILTKATSYENIVLYGAGVVGSKVKDDLVSRGVQKSQLTFAVTSKSDNQDEKDGIPVKQIDEFKGSGDNTIFIITVKEEKQYEMLQNMQRLGIENVLFLSDEVRYSL